MKVGSLFAGIGGIDLGFEQAGAKIIWANEADPYACMTYKLNFENELIEMKIQEVYNEEIPDIDILTGGFPCQSFSTVGAMRGFEDKGKGDLIFEVFRILKAKQPQAVFLENVKGLLLQDKGKSFDTILEHLKNLGYYVKYQLINSLTHGNVPQNRERVYIVSFKNETAYNKFVFPEPIRNSSTIKQIINPAEQKEEALYIPKNTPLYEQQKEIMTNKDAVYMIGAKYKFGQFSNRCPALLATMGEDTKKVPYVTDNFGIRRLTIRECFNIQGFPNDYIIPKNMSSSQLYKQIGNSVTVPVVKRIAENILQALS
ncbi:hypothetical protein AN396_02220 [Candidatus Epulonipiscium fishelsonii]|uniref:Uncharacterized protein n=1 Tax=Candidatus Epulonipiscium fishelsonii TaxID=77094 RepID=A0ACC8XFI6_9FIRM|nr:hypothetical protein AN396_02220 [Epulopiscium sp. SCG-B11WGA-EpuloA1]ONI48345.1 hypothetical protein AN643_01915 [Epulopiscium sp. SCG-B10WGA-EpuloB]